MRTRARAVGMRAPKHGPYLDPRPSEFVRIRSEAAHVPQIVRKTCVGGADPFDETSVRRAVRVLARSLLDDPRPKTGG